MNASPQPKRSFVFRLLRASAVVAVLLAVMLAVALAGLVIYLPANPQFLEWTRGQLETALSSGLAGNFRIGRIEGSLWRELAVDDFEVSLNDDVVLSIPRLTLTGAWQAAHLLRGNIVIESLVASDPEIRMHAKGSDDFDLVEAFYVAETPDEPSSLDEDTSPSPIAIDIRSLEIRNGQFDLRFADGLTFTGDSVDTELSLDLPAQGLDLRVSRLAGNIRVSGAGADGLSALGPLTLALVGRYHDDGRRFGVTLRDVDLRSQHSAGRLNGNIAWDDPDALPTVTAKLFDTRLSPLDVAKLSSGWVPGETISATATMSGPSDDLNITATAELGSGSLAISGRLDLNAANTPFEMTTAIRALDLGLVAKDLALTGSLSGEIKASGTSSFAAILADGSLEVVDLATGSGPIGRIAGEFRAANEQVRFHTTVHQARGSAIVDGVVSGVHAPALEAAVNLERFDLAPLDVRGRLATTDLSGSLGISAEGLQALSVGPIAIERIHGTGKLRLQESQIGSLAIDIAATDVQLDAGRAMLTNLHVETRQGRIEGTAEGPLNGSGPIRAGLRVGIEELGAWLSVANLEGYGRIEGSVGLSGTVAEPAVEASLDGRDVRVEEISLPTLAAEGNVAIGTDQIARGSLVLTGSLAAPIELATFAIDATLAGSEHQEARVDMIAGPADAPEHRTRFAATVLDEAVVLGIQELQSSLLGGPWILVAPAELELSAGEFRLDEFDLRSGDQSLRIDGGISQEGPLDLRIRASRIEIEPLLHTWLPEAALAGTADASIAVAGSGSAPTIAAEARIADLTARDMAGGMARGTASAQLSYVDGEMSARAQLEQDPEHWLRATAQMSPRIAFDRQPIVDLDGPLTGQVQSSTLRLDTFEGLTGPDLAELGGELSVDLSLGGSVTSPALNGSLRLAGGAATVPALGLRLTDGTVDAHLDDSILTIEGASVAAREGTLVAQGNFALLEGPTEPVNLRVQATKWPVIWTSEYQALVAGDLAMRGTVLEPEIAGNVRFGPAFLKPDLSFLDTSAGPPDRDPTITVLRTAPRRGAVEPDGGAKLGFAEAVRADVSLQIARGTRVRHPMADLELEGEVRVRTAPGADPTLLGQVSVVRGWIELQGREFRIRQGRVVFAGGPPDDPVIEVVGEHKRSSYQIRATLGGNVSAPTLELSSEPYLDQADILAVLLFGRPTTQLDQGEKTTLQQQALSMTSGYAASMLGEAVSKALGLESLGVDLRNVDFSGGSIGFGRYLTPRTYVSVKQQLGEENAREVSVEYYLTPAWMIMTSSDTLGQNGADLIWHRSY